MKNLILAALAAAALALPAAAEEEAEEAELGLAGLLSAGNKEDLPPITLSAGAPLAAEPWKLKSGTYYEFEIEGDGKPGTRPDRPRLLPRHLDRRDCGRGSGNPPPRPRLGRIRRGGHDGNRLHRHQAGSYS